MATTDTTPANARPTPPVPPPVLLLRGRRAYVLSELHAFARWDSVLDGWVADMDHRERAEHVARAFGLTVEVHYPSQSPALLRDIAALRGTLSRYFQLTPEEKIRLALDILRDVEGHWDNDKLAHYPTHLPSFDEYIAEISTDLCDIRFHP